MFEEDTKYEKKDKDMNWDGNKIKKKSYKKGNEQRERKISKNKCGEYMARGE